MPKNSKPLLSIIIVSYNTADITVNCLKSILQDKGLKSTPYEIIIIDNSSSDDSVSRIRNFFIKPSSLRVSPLHEPLLSEGRGRGGFKRGFGFSFKLKINQENLGFAKANNQGIKLAQGNYLLFLNSDTVILHSAISQALDWLSSHPEASVCTGQLLNPDQSIQPSGGYFPNLFNVFTWSTGLDDLPLTNLIIKPLHPHPPHFYTHDCFYLRDRQLDWITGAFMLIRRPALDLVKGFDENYFMYSEELELCYRLRQQLPQTQIWYLIGPQIIHLGGASSKNKLNPILNEYRGILAFFRKHASRRLAKTVYLLLKINALFRSIIKPYPYLQAYQQL